MEGKNMISFAEIKKTLPQKYPFLFIDRAIEMKKGEEITCLKNVSGNEPYFVGHFPAQPVMPGVLIIEAIAQAALLLMLKSYKDEISKSDIFVMGLVNQMRFFKPVVPGDQLEIKIKVIKLLKDKLLVSGKVTVDGEPVAQGNLGFGMRKKEDIG